MKKQSGFTLIELLLVLAIIGIISAIAIPALLGQRERAKAKATQENMAGIAGECARVNDQGKETGTQLTATSVVSTVLAMDSYKLPVAKNPYNNAQVGYAASGSTTGQVVMIAGAVTDPVTGGSISAVSLTAFYLLGGATASSTKVVSLD